MTDYTLPCFCLDYTTDEDGIRPESPTEHALGANGCKYPPRSPSPVDRVRCDHCAGMFLRADLDTLRANGFHRS